MISQDIINKLNNNLIDTLDLSYNENSDISVLKCLENNDTLTYLDLGANNISDISILKCLEKNDTLTSLNL